MSLFKKFIYFLFLFFKIFNRAPGVILRARPLKMRACTSLYGVGKSCAHAQHVLIPSRTCA
jgi:hypothetical protein